MACWAGRFSASPTAEVQPAWPARRMLCLLLIRSRCFSAGIMGIEEAVMGLTVSAAGTSLPNLFASMIVAKQVRRAVLCPAKSMHWKPPGEHARQTPLTAAALAACGLDFEVWG